MESEEGIKNNADEIEETVAADEIEVGPIKTVSDETTLPLEITEMVNKINSDIGVENCIQAAIVPEEYKEFFKHVYETRLKPALKKITYIDFEKEEIETKDYEKWMQDMFFHGSSFIRSNGDISYRGYIKGSSKEELWHREFNYTPDQYDILPPTKKTRGYRSGSHLILYYPIIENCKEKCGTVVKYMNKSGEEKKEYLPVNDNVVYCIHDCYFVHAAPDSEPIVEGERIERVIVRYTVIPEGYDWEKSKCPSLLPKLTFDEKDEGAIKDGVVYPAQNLFGGKRRNTRKNKKKGKSKNKRNRNKKSTRKPKKKTTKRKN